MPNNQATQRADSMATFAEQALAAVCVDAGFEPDTETWEILCHAVTKAVQLMHAERGRAARRNKFRYDPSLLEQDPEPYPVRLPGEANA